MHLHRQVPHIAYRVPRKSHIYEDDPQFIVVWHARQNAE
jgi:hypothetical protein